MEVASLKPALEEGAGIRPLSDKQYVANEAEHLPGGTEPELSEVSVRKQAVGEHTKPYDLLRSFARRTRKREAGRVRLGRI